MQTINKQMQNKLVQMEKEKQRLERNLDGHQDEALTSTIKQLIKYRSE